MSLPLCCLALGLACSGSEFSSRPTAASAGGSEASGGDGGTSGRSSGISGENSGGEHPKPGDAGGDANGAGAPNVRGGSAGASSSAGDGSGGSAGNGATLAAFPGAQGFGTETPAGRGGRVYVVTTLDWSGPGSLSQALMATGPRTIVFRVSGVIDVPSDAGSLGEAQSFVTVAGQTSPGGITLRGGLSSYQADFHDAVFRFVRFRGPAYTNLSFNQTHHFVFDHCDFSGSVGESIDISFSHDFTIQWSTITNSGPGERMYGLQVSQPPTSRISLHHNFSAHHQDHCGPHMSWGTGAQAAAPEGGAKIDLRNNVFYNCGDDKVFDVAPPALGFLELNIVGNYAKAGANTPGVSSALVGIGLPAQVYAHENRYDPSIPIFTAFSDPALAGVEFDFPPVTTHSLADVEARVLDSVGAWPRDAMNTRTIAEARAGTGTLGNVGDALIETGPEPPADADRDGIADAWETEHGLDPSDEQDHKADRNGDGYTNLEEYLDELARRALDDNIQVGILSVQR